MLRKISHYIAYVAIFALVLATAYQVNKITQKIYWTTVLQPQVEKTIQWHVKKECLR